jgi:GntR family transcriptional repressor for pyruvate dehydrogenase complex
MQHSSTEGSRRQPFAKRDHVDSQPEQRKYLTIAEAILRGIALGTLGTGDRLPDERGLAQQFNASRATVREALLALELAGVIETRRGAGHYLTMMGLSQRAKSASTLDASPRELLEVRRLLEPATAVLASEYIAPSDLIRLKELVDEADSISDNNKEQCLDHFVELGLAFHRDLARSCGNTVLADIVTHLVDTTAHPLWLLVDRIVARNAQIRHQQIKEHRMILDAITRHRPYQAEKSMAEHLGAVSNRILANNGFRRQPFRRMKPPSPSRRN